MCRKQEIETLDRKGLEHLRTERLRKTIGLVVRSPYYDYGKLFSSNGYSKVKINSVDNVRDLPFTTKEDLRNNFPWGFHLMLISH